MSKKITFVNPKVEDCFSFGFRSRTAPYKMAVLAGQVSGDWKPEIVDENFEQLSYKGTDLAAITLSTPNATRAYEIADRFSDNGVSVLLGGIHPTALPREAMQHGSVVAGEGETVLPKVLNDYDEGHLQKYYYGGHIQMETPKMPRFDLFRHQYTVYPIQFSKGCPNGCEPCSVSIVNGHSYRSKNNQRIVDEINASGGRHFLITDDILSGYTQSHKDDFKLLMKKIKDETNVNLAGQVTVEFAKDADIMKISSEAGLCECLVGFEDIDDKSLRDIGKTINYNVDYRKKFMKPMHDMGFTICGSFMLGLDNHDKSVFKRYTDFVKEVDVDSNAFLVLTPFPGTKLEKRLGNEGRIIRTNYPQDWKYYDTNHAVFSPKNMTAQELEFGTLESLKEVSNPISSIARVMKSIVNTRSVYGSAASFWVNSTVGLRAMKQMKSTSIA
jgi:radical SAM superfamily enzyme YgiQ (UPF0313 family)